MVAVLTAVLVQYRHKTLTKQLPASCSREAFSGTTEGALFLPGAKDDRSALKLGGFSCFRDTPHREAIGVGTGTVRVCQQRASPHIIPVL